MCTRELAAYGFYTRMYTFNCGLSGLQLALQQLSNTPVTEQQR
jgi:hypothetical protein